MPKATAVFDADDSRLSGALARINGKMLALQSRIAKFAVAFIAIRAAAGVMTAGFDRFKQALDVGGQLNDLSANTGIAVADLVVLQQELANAGKSAEDLGPVLGKMAKTLQGGSADDTIKKLAINLEELKKKTPADSPSPWPSPSSASNRTWPSPPWSAHSSKCPSSSASSMSPCAFGAASPRDWPASDEGAIRRVFGRTSSS